MSRVTLKLLDEARELVENRSRTLVEQTRLRLALAAFVKAEDTREITPSEGRLAHYSELVEASMLTASDKHFFKERGVRYLGEALLISYRKIREPESIKRLRTIYGFPADVHPIDDGWSPAYWKDPTFQVLLNEPPGHHSLRLFRWLTQGQQRDITCLGAYLVFQRSSGNSFQAEIDGQRWYYPGGMNTLRKDLHGDSLHAAAVIPPDWTPKPQAG